MGLLDLTQDEFKLNVDMYFSISRVHLFNYFDTWPNRYGESITTEAQEMIKKLFRQINIVEINNRFRPDPEQVKLLAKTLFQKYNLIHDLNPDEIVIHVEFSSCFNMVMCTVRMSSIHNYNFRQPFLFSITLNKRT